MSKSHENLQSSYQSTKVENNASGDRKNKKESDINNKVETIVMSKDKASFLFWIKTHKKQLILIGISLSTLIAIVLGIKNKDTLTTLWKKINEEVQKTDIYSPKWFETASEETLNIEREKVRLNFCSPKNDYSTACKLQNLLYRFDAEISKRSWGNETPSAPSVRREHGWYLFNDD